LYVTPNFSNSEFDSFDGSLGPRPFLLRGQCAALSFCLCLSSLPLLSFSSYKSMISALASTIAALIVASARLGDAAGLARFNDYG